MLSTAVSIVGKVLTTSLGGIPLVNGVYSLGSNVSVCAIPPPIHRTITVSAVAVRFGVPASVGFASSAKTRRGNPAASADRLAALAVFRKSRRFTLIGFGIGFSTAIRLDETQL